MKSVRVQILELQAMEIHHFVVILARHQDAWLLCRHKARRSWEFPGGHIEEHEKPIDAAKRELREETGALEFTIRPVFDYMVTTDTERSVGMVFYAEISKLGKLPSDFEMAKTGHFTRLPDKLTYPEIQPLLLEHWQNLKLRGKI